MNTAELTFTLPHYIETYRFILKHLLIPQKHVKEPYFDKAIDYLVERDYRVFANKKDFIDPNFHSFSRFKKTIFVGQSHNIDMHGMKDEHGFDIAIGTAFKSYDLRKIVDYCSVNNLSIDINNIFTAQRAGTVTRFFQEKYGVKAIQLEFSRSFRESVGFERHVLEIAKHFYGTGY